MGASLVIQMQGWGAMAEGQASPQSISLILELMEEWGLIRLR